MADQDEAVDRLYQLPLAEFTPARNALAKEMKRADLKDLEKPNVAAWAVNQLYWNERAAYDRLIAAATRLRGEHRKLLSGKSSGIREAEQQHREAIRGALDRVRALLQNGGQALSDATLTAVQETLEALPADAPAGRLARPLKPLGFEALSGVTVKPGLRLVEKPARSAATHDDVERTSAADRHDKATRARERQQAQQREKEERERKERQQHAQRELKAAEAAMLQAEEAVKRAEKSLADRRRQRDDAVSAYQRARLRARE
jgi:hypothetical protein